MILIIKDLITWYSYCSYLVINLWICVRFHIITEEHVSCVFVGALFSLGDVAKFRQHLVEVHAVICVYRLVHYVEQFHSGTRVRTGFAMSCY